MDLKICRACLKESYNFKSIFRHGFLLGEETTLASILSFCSTLEFSEDNSQHFPEHICSLCIQELIRCYQFKKKVIASYEFLISAHTESIEEGDTNKANEVDCSASFNEEGHNDTENTLETDDDEAADSVLQELAEAAQMKRQLEYDTQYVQLTILPETNQDPEENAMVIEHQITEDKEVFEREIYHNTEYGEEELEHQEVEIIVGEDSEVVEQTEMREDEEGDVEYFLIDDDNLSQHRYQIDFEQKQSERRKCKWRTKGVGHKIHNPNNQCPICGKQLSNASSFRYHMQLHSNETPYNCTVCGEKFKTRNAYDGHLSTHNPNNPNTCSECGKSYRQPSSLRIHMLTHTGVKPFTCEICGKSLTQKSGYKKHMLTHSGDKPYSCDICDKKFRFSSNMLAHRRGHTEKNFQCTECDKFFPSEEQFKRHTSVHSSDKPFACRTCGKTFKRENTMRSHALIHETQKPAEAQADVKMSKSQVVEIL